MLLRQSAKRKVSSEQEQSAVMSGTVKRVVDNDGVEKRQAGCSEMQTDLCTGAFQEVELK